MSAPRVTLDPLHTARATGDATWRVSWRLANHGPSELRIARVSAPHGRFRAADRDWPVVLARGASTELALEIRCDAQPGSEIENAFVIVTADHEGATWRILARLRVREDAAGVPRPVTERIDVQEVGFSGRG